MNKLKDILSNLTFQTIALPGDSTTGEIEKDAEQAIIDLFLSLAESCQSKDGFGQTIIVPAELRTKIQALSNKEAK